MSKNLLTPIHNAQVNPVLEFRDGQCLFRMVNLEGGTHERLISFAAVREACTGIPVDSGWLAPEICRWGTGRNGDWAIASIPPGVHELELMVGTPGKETLERIRVPLPGIVFFGIAVKYWVFASKTGTLHPEHTIFRAPLPNVMQDASVCWGLHKPPLASARTILQAWRLFISSTFNHHAANGKSKKNREDVREVLRELAADGTEYPVDDLVRYDEKGSTLDHLIRAFMQSGEMPQ